MADNLFGILGGLALGVLVALFVPGGISLVIVVALLIVALLPQFMRYRTPAILALLAIIVVFLVRYYGIVNV
jgi:hypothetical protein